MTRPTPSRSGAGRFPDIAVTHNGHITNYHKMRQRFEAEGFGFASHNDSEIIGIYLGRKMAEGLTLHDALAAAGRELDGSYSFIVATQDGLGVVRDPFATKPLLYVETDDQVALASEPQALHRLLGAGRSDQRNQATGGARMGEGLKNVRLRRADDARDQPVPEGRGPDGARTPKSSCSTLTAATTWRSG